MIHKIASHSCLRTVIGCSVRIVVSVVAVALTVLLGAFAKDYLMLTITSLYETVKAGMAQPGWTDHEKSGPTEKPITS